MRIRSGIGVLLRLAFVGVLLACVSGAKAGTDDAGLGEPLVLELLDADLPATARDEAWEAVDGRYVGFGDGSLRTLPFRDRGTWLRITRPHPATHDAVLVVDSMVAAPITLALPDGRETTRSKLAPQIGPGASAIAQVFPLDPARDVARPLYLHFEHHHPALLRDRKSTRLNSSHYSPSRMPSSA